MSQLSYPIAGSQREHKNSVNPLSQLMKHKLTAKGFTLCSAVLKKKNPSVIIEVLLNV